MDYKSFSFQLILRIILLVLSVFFLNFSLNQPQWYITSSVSALLLVILSIELVRFASKANRYLSRLILALQQRDFTTHFSVSEEVSGSFSEVKEALNSLAKEFQNIRIEKEVHYQYLKVIVEHLNVALICFTTDNKIQLSNRAAKKLLHLFHFESINQLKSIDTQLYYLLNDFRKEGRHFIEVRLGEETLPLTVLSTVFKLRNTSYKLVTLQNIQNELDYQEVESWQKLIRVLRHEIMNSVTPIASLSEAMNEMLLDESSQQVKNNIQYDDLQELHECSTTIKRRSRALINFINSYKHFTQIPQPVYEKISVQALFSHLATLLKQDIEQQGTNLEVAVGQAVSFVSDRELLEQVLINLIINAKMAVHNCPEAYIRLISFTTDNQVIIQVKDNGRGIKAEHLSKIFIPFFTTQPKGSGIGLSVSKQIINLLGGSISVHSIEGEGTTFTVKLKQ